MSEPPRHSITSAAATDGRATHLPVLQASELELAGLPDSRIDLELHPGERWLVTGAAGSGKTTLARTLLGLISPVAGSIALFGHDLDDLTPEGLLALRRATVLVTSSDGLFPAWTGFDNLSLPLRYHGLAGSPHAEANRAEAIAAWIADRARAYRVPGHWLDQPVAERSREQRLVLALMRATALAVPRLMIIDGIDLEHALAATEIDGEALLEDALTGAPAIVVLQSLEAARSGTARSGRLPAAFDPPRFRHGRLDAGTLQWLPAHD